MIAMIVGTALALITLAYVLYPLYVGTKPPAPGDLAGACPKCASPVEDDATFCSSCGSPLVSVARPG